MASPADRKRLKEKAAVEKARKALLANPPALPVSDESKKMIDDVMTEVRKRAFADTLGPSPIASAKAIGMTPLPTIPEQPAGHPGTLPVERKKKRHVIKPRLPNGSMFIAGPYNAEKELWKGILLVPSEFPEKDLPEIAKAVEQALVIIMAAVKKSEAFRGKRNGVFRLMETLDDYFRQYMEYKEKQAQESAKEGGK